MGHLLLLSGGIGRKCTYYLARYHLIRSSMFFSETSARMDLYIRTCVFSRVRPHAPRTFVVVATMTNVTPSQAANSVKESNNEGIKTCVICFSSRGVRRQSFPSLDCCCVDRHQKISLCWRALQKHRVSIPLLFQLDKFVGLFGS